MKKILLALGIIAIAGFATCFGGSDDSTTDVAVTGVSLNKSSTSILTGGTEQLTATITPSNATNKNVTWTSNNDSTATVSTEGLVSAIAAGTAIITVTTEDENFTADCSVTVIPEAGPGVTLDKSTAVIFRGGTKQLTATVTNTTDTNVTWTSNDTSIATVSSGGLVSGIAAGAAKVTVTTADGNKTASCDVTVSAWSALGSGVDGTSLRALIIDSSGNLYAGGNFKTADNPPQNYIAKWNGSSWANLGTVSSTVYTLIFDSTGTLYAGGQFTTVGGNSANRIAKWDGSNWSALGTGMDGTVLAFAFDSSGNLYAGGQFTTAGGSTANRIAKWNGSTWSPLGTGMNDAVCAIACDQTGNVYAGGIFTTADGTITVNGIARWNGTSWSALGSGVDATKLVKTLAFDSTGNLYAGGDFTTMDGITVNGIAKWNGTTWTALGVGVSGSYKTVHAIKFDSLGNLYAGGDFYTAGGNTAKYIAKWDGTSWSGIDAGFDGTIFAIVYDPIGKYLYAGGNIGIAGSTTVDHVARIYVGE